MTTRFSIAELAEMLHQPIHVVRMAVDDLAERGELTAESFQFGEKSWRVAPSDVKKVTEWIENSRKGSLPSNGEGRRRVVRRVVEPPAES